MPTSVKPCAVAGANPGEVLVTWIGSGTGFSVQYMRPGGGSYRNPSGTCNLASTYVSAALTCTATSVPVGTNKFRVATYRNTVTGAWSQLASVIVPGAPGAPVIGAATVTGSTTATVAFTAPTPNGGATITKYTATSSPAGGSGTLEQAGDGTINVTGLTAGTSYTFTVTATNTAGLTSASSAPSGSVTTIGVPGAPVIGAATKTNTNHVNVAFTAPTSNGGSPITKYTATSNPDGITGTVEQAGSGTITVMGLTSGTSYTFTVTATNTEGLTSLASAPSNSVTIQVPGAPVITKVENYTWSDCVRMKVTIGKPTSDGGSPITKYTVMLNFNNGGTKTAYSYPSADATSGTVNWNDLPPAQGAKLTVTATNEFGVSTASTESETRTSNQPTGPTRNCS